MGIGDDEGDNEGRVITMVHKRFVLVNVYTPNSGDMLKRLSYRTDSWDHKFAGHISKLRLDYPSRPVIVCGDLNVAHTHLDHFNHGNARCRIQAGTTPQEQMSFQINLLDKAGLKVCV
jgi:exodeoxyribonuclease III